MRLRNKEIVNAENFDSVTILFSDIPVFGMIAAASSPLITIALLNEVYIKIDSVLGQFDVYKVETINDSYIVRSSNRFSLGSAGYVQLKCIGSKWATDQERNFSCWRNGPDGISYAGRYEKCFLTSRCIATS